MFAVTTHLTKKTNVKKRLKIESSSFNNKRPKKVKIIFG